VAWPLSPTRVPFLWVGSKGETDGAQFLWFSVGGGEKKKRARFPDAASLADGQGEKEREKKGNKHARFVFTTWPAKRKKKEGGGGGNLKSLPYFRCQRCRSVWSKDEATSEFPLRGQSRSRRFFQKKGGGEKETIKFFSEGCREPWPRENYGTEIGKKEERRRTDKTKRVYLFHTLWMGGESTVRPDALKRPPEGIHGTGSTLHLFLAFLAE